MLFGPTFRLPGEFFDAQDQPADPHGFLNKLQEHFITLKPVPTSHHSKIKHFIHKDLLNCSQVFRRIDQVRRPLEPPYSGHEVIRRINNKVFVIMINGEEKSVLIDSLKPAFMPIEEGVQPYQALDFDPSLQSSDQFLQQPSSLQRTVHFSPHSHPKNVSRGGVPVAAQPQSA